MKIGIINPNLLSELSKLDLGLEITNSTTSFNLIKNLQDKYKFKVFLELCDSSDEDYFETSAISLTTKVIYGNYSDPVKLNDKIIFDCMLVQLINSLAESGSISNITDEIMDKLWRSI